MDPSSHHTKPTTHAHKPASPTDLLASAKVVAGAAQSALQRDTDKVDKAKAADAAGDLLGAASYYGKLEEKGFGEYVEKAETYLHGYQSSQPATTTESATAAPHSSTAQHASSGHSTGGGGDHSEGGFGDYMKMAEGFLKKH